MLRDLSNYSKENLPTSSLLASPPKKAFQSSLIRHSGGLVAEDLIQDETAQTRQEWAELPPLIAIAEATFGTPDLRTQADVQTLTKAKPGVLS